MIGKIFNSRSSFAITTISWSNCFKIFYDRQFNDHQRIGTIKKWNRSKLKYLNPGFYLFQSGKLHDVIRDWYFQPRSTLFQPCDWFEMIPFQSVWHDASITKVDFSVTKSITNFTFNVTKPIWNNFPSDKSHNLGEGVTGPFKFIWSAMRNGLNFTLPGLVLIFYANAPRYVERCGKKSYCIFYCVDKIFIFWYIVQWDIHRPIPRWACENNLS